MTHDTVVITGIGKRGGIGAAIAHRLAKAGYHLLLSHHPDDPDPLHIVKNYEQMAHRLKLLLLTYASRMLPKPLSTMPLTPSSIAVS